MQGILLTAGRLFFDLLQFLIVGNVILSWLPIEPDNPIARVIRGLTEPLISPLRRFATFGSMDFSALAALLIIQFLLMPFYTWLIRLLF